jgi:hypothetical protein
MYSDTGGYHSVIDERGQFQAARANRRGWRSVIQPDRFCTTDVRVSALKA